MKWYNYGHNHRMSIPLERDSGESFSVLFEKFRPAARYRRPPLIIMVMIHDCDYYFKDWFEKGAIRVSLV